MTLLNVESLVNAIMCFLCSSGNRVVATCPNKCIYQLSVIEGASFAVGERGSGTVTFSYAINVLDGSSISDDPEIRPVLSLYCDNCSNYKVWSSVDTSESRTDGIWVLASVVIKSRGTFSVSCIKIALWGISLIAWTVVWTNSQSGRLAAFGWDVIPLVPCVV